MRPVFHGVLLGVSLCYLGACGSDNPAAPQVGRVAVTPDSVNLYQLDSIQLHASVLDMDGHPMSGREVTYTSSDTTRVKVSALGMAVSKGLPGKVSVAVKTEGAETDVPLVITARSTSLQLSPDPVTLGQLENLQLSAEVLDAIGNPISEDVVTFTSLTPSKISVTTGGLLHSVGPTGTAFIALSGGGIAKSVQVTITQVATTLKVLPTVMHLTPSGNRRIEAVVLDGVGDTIPGLPITYHSEDAAIATVSADGTAHAVGPLGATGIEVSAAGLRDTIPVTVVATWHPEGRLEHTTPVAEGAFGVGISALGAVYVAHLPGQISRGNLPDYALATTDTLGRQPVAVTFNASGTLAYVAGAPLDGLSVIRVADNVVVGTKTGLQVNVFDVKLSQDGQTLYAAGDKHVYALDVATLNVIHQFDLDTTALIHLAINPVNGDVYASGLGIVEELDGTTLARLRQFTGARLVQGIVVSSDGATLYEAVEDTPRFSTVDLATGNPGIPIATCAGYGLAVSKDGLTAYMSCPLDGQVQVIDLVNHLVAKTIFTGGHPRRMALDPSGLVLAVANESGWVDFIF
ncbi:MAG TPA: YncE family protein [Gemmatimonadales bacterium]|nr:YncE family protein [Gemmatimonadales bacterium]